MRRYEILRKDICEKNFSFSFCQIDPIKIGREKSYSLKFFVQTFSFLRVSCDSIIRIKFEEISLMNVHELFKPFNEGDDYGGSRNSLI